MQPQHQQESFSSTLAAWRVEPTSDPNFRPKVWARLASGRNDAGWIGFANAHAPVLAAAFAFALVLGGWLGTERAEVQAQSARSAILEEYVRGLDARAMQRP